MPVLAPPVGPLVIPPAPGVPLGRGHATATWTTPDGQLWSLTDDMNEPGVSTLPGVSGIGAGPRAVSRRSLATGGTVPRWSHVDERLIAWPLEARVLGDPAAYLDLWRRLIRAFTSTTPDAGAPRPGILRITRADASWREASCIYLGGFDQVDDEGEGYDRSTAVLSLAAPDPRWYGESVVALAFDYTSARSYLEPYETVSPATALGEQTVEILGDVDALPVWTLIGPASGFTVTLPAGSFTFTAALLAGQSVVVDVGASTVVDNTGANRIGDLAWPSSDLVPLPVGQVPVNIVILGAGAGAGVHLSYRPRFESA